MAKHNGKEEQFKTEKISMPQDCRLTNTELRERGKALGQAIYNRSKVESELESFRTGKKAEIAKIEEMIAILSSQLTTETETRTVQCAVVWDFAQGKKFITREDTGELIGTTSITDTERQLHFSDAVEPAGRH